MPSKKRGMRVLALVTDAWGGTGGIAQYDRDFIEDVAGLDSVAEVVVIPRVIAREIQPLPATVTHVASAAGSKTRFVRTAVAAAMHRPDVVICGHVNLLPVAWFASKVARAPLMLLTYGIEVWEPRGALWQRLLRACRVVVSISDFTLQRLRAWAPMENVKTFLVPNAIDVASYNPGPPDESLRTRLGIPSGKPLLLTLGRMDASEQAKGFDEIIDVLPSLLKEYPDLQYCAAGDGSDRARLQAKVEALGLSDHVVFPGYVREDDKTALYRLADVYVMPSRLEGFGYVFLEAIACGIPVIASKVDGSREAVLGGELGLMVNPANATELRTAIVSALKSPFVPPHSQLDYFSRSRFAERVSQAIEYASGLG